MPGKVKTLIDIAHEYGVHLNTVKNWLKPIMSKLKGKSKRKRLRLLLPWQVDLIYEYLDKPDSLKDKEDDFLS